MRTFREFYVNWLKSRMTGSSSSGISLLQVLIIKEIRSNSSAKLRFEIIDRKTGKASGTPRVIMKMSFKLRLSLDRRFEKKFLRFNFILEIRNFRVWFSKRVSFQIFEENWDDIYSHVKINCNNIVFSNFPRSTYNA